MTWRQPNWASKRPKNSSPTFKRRSGTRGSLRELELKAAQLRLDALKATESITSPAVAIQELAVQQAQLALDQLESGLDARYQYDLNGARAQYNLDTARIALRRAETALARTQLLAPIAGVARFDDILKKGKVVEAFTPVGAVVDPKSLVVESNLAPSDLERLQEGLAVTLRLGEAPTQRELPGVVARLPQPYGTGTRTVAEFMPTAANDVNLLRPGIQVEIGADLARAADALWLPPDAILGFKDNYFVRLPDGSQVPVKVGIFGQDTSTDPGRHCRGCSRDGAVGTRGFYACSARICRSVTNPVCQAACSARIRGRLCCTRLSRSRSVVR